MDYDPQSFDAAAMDHAQLDSKTRWAIFWLLIICSLAVVCARLWQVQAVSAGQEVPFLSANDRSRWCTIRSLGDDNTYAIDGVLADTGGEAWDTIDKVLHWGRDQRPHFYSSKPPFLSTVLTYPYLAIRYITGWTLKNDTFDVVRWMLVIAQVIPLFFFFWSTGRIAELVAESEWTRMFLMASAAFGTLVTTFAISLNNHLPAVCLVSVSLYGLILIWTRCSDHPFWYFLCGLTAALAAACEMPAASFLVAALVLCMLRSVSKTLFAFAPAATLVVAAFFSTNYTAHQDWRPPYAHRSDGPVLTIVDDISTRQLAEGQISPRLQESLMAVRDDLQPASFEAVRILRGGWPVNPDEVRSRWILYFDEQTLPVVLVERADGPGVAVHRWNNWYEYPGSYWLKENPDRAIVDRGEPRRDRYLFHLTLGHHGVFSLTPIWYLSIFGVLAMCVAPRYGLRLPALAILAISVVVIAFYVSRPLEDRNYGGLCCGPRWLFWLIPLWLLVMIPALDAISESRPMRFVALLLLAISIAASFYAWSNPWVHPWIYTWTGGV
jgi:hypothetical protein